MAKMMLFVFMSLVLYTSAFRIPEFMEDVDDSQDRREFEETLNKHMQDEDMDDVAVEEPEAYRNTFLLLDAIMLDEASVHGGKVEYFFGKGISDKCINGKKTLAPKCRWTGQVVQPGEKPVKEKLLVFGKYCHRAGLAKPKSKQIDC